jgi:hypothetical protein
MQGIRFGVCTTVREETPSMRAHIGLAMLVAALGALGACAGDTSDDGGDADNTERRRPKPVVDAPPPSPTTGSVTCYSASAPTATCTAPSQCCFGTGYDPDGVCSTSTCAWGAVRCDGPEDCASGERCCATVTSSGVTVACAASCLPLEQGGDEVCHEPALCSNGRWCITAFGTQPALPRNLSICRG